MNAGGNRPGNQWNISVLWRMLCHLVMVWIFLSLQSVGPSVDFGTTPATTSLHHLRDPGGEQSMKTGKTPIPMLATCLLFLACINLQGATYEVGPNKPLTDIGQVPWESLQAGDTVLIHWRSNPYKEKWVICRQGTQAVPITVRGVPGPAGELPVIDGRCGSLLVVHRVGQPAAGPVSESEHRWRYWESHNHRPIQLYRESCRQPGSACQRHAGSLNPRGTLREVVLIALRSFSS